MSDGSLSTPPRMYRTPRAVKDFTDANGGWQPGAETSGFLVTYAAMDAHAAAATSGLPCEILIVGEHKDYKGRRRLIEATNVQWILDTHPGLRLDKDGKLREFCPECEGWSGKHSRSCKRA